MLNLVWPFQFGDAVSVFDPKVVGFVSQTPDVNLEKEGGAAYRTGSLTRKRTPLARTLGIGLR